MKEIAPDTFASIVIESFSDSLRGAYAQVATLDPQRVPQVRTVHVHYLPEVGELAFSSHRSSHKWDHIRANGLVSGCWFDTFRGLQLRWESKGRLIDDSDAKNGELLQEMWMKMRKEVREAYWLDHMRKPLISPIDIDINADIRTPSHGVVLCEATTWDIMRIDPKGYRFGERTVHHLEAGRWKSKTISILKDY